MLFSAAGNQQQEGGWSEAELEKAHTAADVPYRTAEGKKVLQLMNPARVRAGDSAKGVLTFYSHELWESIWTTYIKIFGRLRIG